MLLRTIYALCKLLNLRGFLNFIGFMYFFPNVHLMLFMDDCEHIIDMSGLVYVIRDSGLCSLLMVGLSVDLVLCEVLDYILILSVIAD